MTSWQEPPLTRREARERERLLAQQAGSAATGEAALDGGPAAPPVPPQSFAIPPVPPADDLVRAGEPVSPEAPATSFIPPTLRPVEPQPAPAAAPLGSSSGSQSAVFAPPAPTPQQRPRPQAAPQPEHSSTPPERTLTRRELRAMLASSQAETTTSDLDAHDVEAPVGSVPAPRSAEPSPAEASARPSALPTGAAPGHWAAELHTEDDAPEPFDQLLARGGLSHGVPTTTNALILPALPDQHPLTNPGPLTGEIIVTGSVDLPRSFGTTGAHPGHIDSTEVDRLFDQVEDAESSGVAPVAATHAISTQGGARTVIAPPKKEGPNVPLILAITAGVLALGVVATLVAGWVFNLF